MKIPFTIDNNKRNIYLSDQLDYNFQIKNYNLLNIIEKMTENNDKNNLKLMKASESKKYYEKINKTKKE